MSADRQTVARVLDALDDLERSPLSRKKAMLLALLIDRAVDEQAGTDLLAYRIRRAKDSLGVVMELAAMRDDGPDLTLETAPLEDLAAASEADYMISVYNDATVQRVRIAWPDGRREDALPILREAAATVAHLDEEDLA